MTQTVIHRIFSPLKKVFPSWLWNPLRSIGTAIIGPIRFAYRSGFWHSSFKMAAVDRHGVALPWYTYPSIDFLKHRDFHDKSVLEFGGGQSSLWWAQRAKQVVTLEGDPEWYQSIKDGMPENVDLCFVSTDSKQENVSQVNATLEEKAQQNGLPKYDVLIIDGLYRREMIDIALDYVSEDGIIICDNADGYGFFEGFKDSGLKRVDFFGNAPGVVLPHCTSIYFNAGTTIFDAAYPIPVIAQE